MTRQATVFVLYMGLSVLYGLLVHASRRPGSRPFSPIVAVLAAEWLKLVFNGCIFMYMQRFCHLLARGPFEGDADASRQAHLATAGRGTRCSL